MKVSQLDVQGAMTALLKMPFTKPSSNSENNPALMHGGPLQILRMDATQYHTKTALKMADCSY